MLPAPSKATAKASTCTTRSSSPLRHTTPAAALEALRATNPSLILLDLRMPGMNGREFVQAYRERESQGVPQAQRVPIIVVTASRLPEVDPEEMGASGVLHKPFEVDRLLESVARYVRGPG